MIQNKIERRILWGDLDSLCIVFYPKYYEWIDGCSHLFFEKISLDLVKLWKNRQLIFSLVKTSCEYIRPGRYLQDIVIATHIEKLEKKTITVHHSITDKATGKVMVRGVEKRICMGVEDLNNFKAMDIPEDIYEIFENCL